MSARELTLDLARTHLAARAWGDPACEPVLALHGWLDNAASFDGIAPYLAEHLHLVALDLPGHGRSAHRGDAHWYHVVDYLPDVLDAANALGWKTFHLIGHSLGAGIASLLAAACPQRLRKLVLIELLGPFTHAPEKTGAALRTALTAQRESGSKSLRVFASIDAAIHARMLSNGLSQNAARALVERGIERVAGGYSWTSDPRLTLPSPQRFDEAQLLDILAGIEAPTQLILADPITWPADAGLLAARIARVAAIEVVRLPGHHHLHLEAPEPIAQAIGRFLQPPQTN